MKQTKVGDKFKLVKDLGLGRYTLGKIYTIVEVPGDGNVYVLNNNGAQEPWGARYFDDCQAHGYWKRVASVKQRNLPEWW